jgi:transcriptional regulator GlxA family with amidase domain
VLCADEQRHAHDGGDRGGALGGIGGISVLGATAGGWQDCRHATDPPSPGSRRRRGQSQFSGALSVQQASWPALRDLQAWIAGHLDEDLSVAALTDRAGLSERSFARAFRAEVGQTPTAYVEALRVERARLEDGAPSLESVARAAGFFSPEILRRAFHRRLGVSPAGYRERFRLDA